MQRFHQRSQVLTKGLRRHYQEVPNSFELFDLFNFKPTKRGLVAYEPVLEAIKATDLQLLGIGQKWPFPQFFIGKRYVILADESKIYLVNRDDFSQPLIELAIYDADNPTTQTTIPAGGPWEFVDMQESWILSNGESVVFYPGSDAMLGNELKVYIKKNLSIETIAFFKGRVVFGGLDFNRFWDSTWQTFWNTWSKYKVDTGLVLTRQKDTGVVTMPMEENFIWYSLIGGGDLLWLFFPKLAEDGVITTTYGASKPMLFDLWKRGDQGFEALDGIGKVRKLLPLGEFLIAYLDNAVIALRNVLDPIPHLGQKVIFEGGVVAKGAAGDRRKHVFLDSAGNLLSLDANLKLTVEGYREFLWPLANINTLIHHSVNPQDVNSEGEFYICSENKTFIFNGELFEVGQQIKSAQYFNGATLGITDYYDVGADEGRIGIDVFDFGDAGLKQLDAFQLSMKEVVSSGDLPTVSLAVDYRPSNRMDYKTTSYRLFNNNGDCYFPVTSLDFRFRVKVDDYTKLKRIWGFTPVIKFVDRRFRRSTSVNQINS